MDESFSDIYTMRGFFRNMKSFTFFHFCCKNIHHPHHVQWYFLPTLENQLQHLWLSHFLSFVVDLSRDTNPSLRRSENFFSFCRIPLSMFKSWAHRMKVSFNFRKSRKIWMISCSKLICMAFLQRCCHAKQRIFCSDWMSS